MGWILEPGSLSKYGYRTKASKANRHSALRKAVQEYGKDGVIRKLTAVGTLSKNRNPKASAVFIEDKEYVRSL